MTERGDAGEIPEREEIPFYSQLNSIIRAYSTYSQLNSYEMRYNNGSAENCFYLKMVGNPLATAAWLHTGK